MPRVILRSCDEYDPDRIRGIVGESMDELGLKPNGRTLLKPNTVIAHRLFFPHAFTRPEVLDGILGAVRERGEEITELSVGERCGITMPTRYCFAEAKYGPVIRKHRAKTKYFDEMPQVRRDLFHDGRLRDYIYIPEAIAETEWYISVPKFKAHPWTKVTFNLKLYIGIQDDEHRLIDHDHHLHTKVADLYEVIQPKLCVVDSIVAGAKTMMTPLPFDLGLLVIGDDAVATDVVCTHIAGLDPRDVDHIRITAERGWGSLSLDDVQIDGDVSFDEATARAKGFELTLDPIDRIFNGKSSLQVYLGPPPDTYAYCSGGCPGALFEAMHYLEQLQPNVRDEVRRMHLVFGAYDGPIEPRGREPVLFIGDCATYKGEICGKQVEIPFLYKDRQMITPERVRHSGLVLKMVGVLLTLLRYLGRRVKRATGCTVSVSEALLLVVALGRTANPFLEPRLIIRFAWSWVIHKIVRFFAKLRSPHPEALQQRDS